MEIFEHILYHNKLLESITDPTERLDIILKSLFQTIFIRVSRGMLYRDRITLAVQLTRIYLKNIIGNHMTFEDEFYQMAQALEDYSEMLNIENKLSDSQKRALAHLSSNLSSLKNVNRQISSNSDQFDKWLNSNDVTTRIPTIWEHDDKTNPINFAVYSMLLTRALRPDRLILAAKSFVESVFGLEFVQKSDALLNFEQIINEEIQGLTPILLCSVPGYDASNRVEELATHLNKNLTGIAIGSAEGFSLAEQAINSAAKQGNWVLLKNVHLAPQWLKELEKKLHSLKPHESFRLFLSTEIHPKLPTSLLRMGLCLVFEPATGVRPNLMRTLNEFSESRMERSPQIRPKAYFRLAWLHALVTERLRYTPLGWSKHYEINESDLRFACDTIDQWISTDGKTEISWDALQYLIASCIYGGRLDNRFDQRLLASFVKQLFCQESLNNSYPLIKDDSSSLSMTMPQETTKHKYVDWIKHLPSNEKPTWLGLPDNAEKVLLISEGNKFSIDLLKCGENDENALTINFDIDEHKEENEAAGRPAWMIQVQHTTDIWLKTLPKSLHMMKRTSENIKDPLFRCVEREVNFASNLLRSVRQDLSDIQAVCDGTKKQTNDTRDLLNNLSKGITPPTWKKYRVPPRISAMQWMSDFVARLKQLDKLATLTTNENVQALRRVEIWLGGLFTPEAYLTATRQCAAQSLHVSLEELVMHVQMLDQSSQIDSNKENLFLITGLKLQGACCRNNSLFYSSSIMDDIPLLTVQWKISEKTKKNQQEVNLPVYGNGLRTELLCTINVKVGQANAFEFHFYERGVAVLASSLE